MESQQYDVAIAGGGIIGLSTAMHLTQRFPDLKVAVLEKEAELATHQRRNTFRNLLSPWVPQGQFLRGGRSEVDRSLRRK